MAGRPGIVNPKKYLLLTLHLTSYHIFGNLFVSKCGSLQRIGLPDSVLEPLTAQLFEAIIGETSNNHFTSSGTILV